VTEANAGNADFVEDAKSADGATCPP